MGQEGLAGRARESVLQITDRRLTAWGLPGGRAKSSKPMWPADRVVFLNDVYFCARDTIRLLQHDGDMVCGLDFDRPKLEEMPGEVSCYFHLGPLAKALNAQGM